MIIHVRVRRTLGRQAFLSLLLFCLSFSLKAATCSEIFPGGIESHSASGSIYLGYMSRVYGSGTSLVAPTVTHNSTYMDQAGYCDGVKCTATGTYSSVWTPAFLTGTGAGGNIGAGAYREADISKAQGDYAAVNVGQEAVVKFTTASGTYRFKSFQTNYRSIIEFQAGDYYIDGTLTLDNETYIRRASGASGPVRIFVSGNVTIKYNMEFQNFTSGQLLIYSKGDIKFDSRKQVYATLYAANALSIDYTAQITGALSGSTLNIGQEAKVTYPGASSIAPVCGDDSASAPTLHHYQLTYSSPAVSCQAIPVTVTACADASCSTTFPSSNSIGLTPSDRWIGGATKVFNNSATLTAYLTRTVGTAALGVTNATGTTCSTPGCSIEVVASGFIFPGLASPTALLANKPLTDVVIQAVTSANDNQSCAPGFAGGAKTVNFWSGYADPGSGSMKMQVNDTDIGTVSSSPTSLSLGFDAQAKATIKVKYPDAGNISLNASYAGSETTGDMGLSLAGSTMFVSRPYGLCLQSAIDALPQGQRCNSDGLDCPLFPGGVRAGDEFPLTIKAVAWERDGEALDATALCTGNAITPNFRLSGMKLSSTVTAPVGGQNAELGATTYTHVVGNSTSVSQRVLDVGIFTLTAATPAAGYFGYPVSGTSNRLGRFIPAYLQPSMSTAFTPACGTYSYQSQTIPFTEGSVTPASPVLTVTGRTRLGGDARNYDMGDFWRLINDPSPQNYVSVTGTAALDARLDVAGAVTVNKSDQIKNDGRKEYKWAGQTLSYTAAIAPSAADYPFQARVRRTFPAATLTDADGACYLANGTGACADYVYDIVGSEVRLGRLSIANASGSELQALSMPLQLQTWQGTNGGTFQIETADNCSAPLIGAKLLDSYTGALSVGETMATDSGSLSAGTAVVNLSAPGSGNQGSVTVSYPSSPEWLKYNWNGTGRQIPRGIAVFGTYTGQSPLIFRREIYR
jgi:MSHA biogenesis protein MshQ